LQKIKFILFYEEKFTEHDHSVIILPQCELLLLPQVFKLETHFWIVIICWSEHHSINSMFSNNTIHVDPQAVKGEGLPDGELHEVVPVPYVGVLGPDPEDALIGLLQDDLVEPGDVPLLPNLPMTLTQSKTRRKDAIPLSEDS
jgi:hypothetical protein